MEKIKSICMMRELMKAMTELEAQLQNRHGVSSNEAMALCCIGDDTITASTISENTGMLPSHTSKVLKALETKGLISRALGQTDRRQMHFTLTDIGLAKLRDLKTEQIDIPEYLKPLL